MQARLALRLAGMRLRVGGLEALPLPSVVVANHVSYLDGVVLHALLPVRFSFVIKREMSSVPLAGLLLRRLGAEFVERRGRAQGSGMPDGCCAKRARGGPGVLPGRHVRTGERPGAFPHRGVRRRRTRAPPRRADCHPRHAPLPAVEQLLAPPWAHRGTGIAGPGIAGGIAPAGPHGRREPLRARRSGRAAARSGACRARRSASGPQWGARLRAVVHEHALGFHASAPAAPEPMPQPSSLDLRALYARELQTRGFGPDAAQQAAVDALEAVRTHLLQRAERGLLGRLRGRWRGIGAASAVRGVYLWGPVGRGKTWLMDLFYDSLPLRAKRRRHFHHLMRDVHALLGQLRGRSDPMVQVARTVAAGARVLCLDELFVSDIADAAILGELFTQLLERGTTLVIAIRSRRCRRGSGNAITYCSLRNRECKEASHHGIAPRDFRLLRVPGRLRGGLSSTRRSSAARS